MAIPIAKAFVDVQLNQKAFLSGLAGSQAAFTKTTGSMQARAAATGAAITKSFVAATAGLALLGGVVAMGVKSAASYETAWREVWTLMSVTEDQMKSLADTTSRMSVAFGQSEKIGLKALYQITSAGFIGAEAMTVLEESLKGAVGGVSDVFTAADILTGALNAWNVATTQSAHVMDLIFTTIKEGKVTMDSLAAGAGRVMAIAGPFGIAMEEAFASLATLTKPLGGVHLAATALVATIRSFLKPQEELNELMEEMGYETGRVLVEEKGLAGAIVAVKDAAGAAGIPLEVLFSNVRAMMGVMPLATTMSEEYARILDSMYDSLGATSGAVEKMMQSFEMQWSIFSKTLGRAKRLFGEAFLPIFTSGLEKMIPYVERLAEYFRRNGDAIRYFVMHAMKMLGIIVAVGALAKALHLLMTPVGALIAAAALLYGAWYFNLYGIQEMAEQLGETLTKVVLAPLKFVLKLAGADEAASSMETFMGSLNKALVGIVAALGGFVLGTWLVRGLLGKLTGAVLAGSVLTLPTLAVTAALAWDISQTFGDLKEPAGMWPSIAKLASQAIGAITGGILGAAVGHPIMGAALGAYAFGWMYEGLMRISWDIFSAPAGKALVDTTALQKAGEAAVEATADALQKGLEQEDIKTFLTGPWLEAFRAAETDRDWLVAMQSFYDAVWNMALELNKIVAPEESAKVIDEYLAGLIDALEDPTRQARLRTAFEKYFQDIFPEGFQPTWKSTGGPATPGGFQVGGPIPGVGFGDTIPAMLEPGEFVVPSWMMRIPWLASLIGGIWSKGPRFQAGGATAGLATQLAGAGMPPVTAMSTEEFKAYIDSLNQSMPAFLKTITNYIAAHGQARENVVEFTMMLNELFTPLGDLDTEFGDLVASTLDQINAANEEAAASADMATALGALTERIRALPFGELLTSIPYINEAIFDLRIGTAENLGAWIDSMASLRNAASMVSEALKAAELIGASDAVISELRALADALPKLTEAVEDAVPVFTEFEQAGLEFVRRVGIHVLEQVVPEPLGGGLAGALPGVLAVIGGFLGMPIDMGILVASAADTLIWALDLAASAEDRKREAIEEATEKIRTGFATMSNAADMVSGAFFNLARQSEAFQRLQAGFRSVWGLLIDSLFGALWPLVAILETVVGTFQQETDAIQASTQARLEEFEALNVPVGFKGARYEWRAAEPGVPYRPWEEEVPPAITPPEIEFPIWVMENLEALGEIITPLITIIDMFRNSMEKAWSSIIPSLVAGILPVINTFGWLTDLISEWIGGVFAPDLARFAEGFGSFWETMVDPFIREDFGPTVAGWLNRMYGWLDDIIGFFAGPVWTWITGPFWKMLKPHVSKILGMFEDFGKWVAANWESTIAPFLKEFVDIWLKDFEGGLDDFLGNIIAFVTGSKGMGDEVSDVTWALEAFGTALKFIREAADFLGDALVAVAFLVALPFNAIIAFFNGIIKFLNLIPFVNIPEIPYIDIKLPGLAAGGIITSPTLAMLGEAGPEGVFPLGAFRGLDDLSGGLQTTDITLNLTVKSTLVTDGREIASAVARQDVKREIIRGRY